MYLAGLVRLASMTSSMSILRYQAVICLKRLIFNDLVVSWFFVFMFRNPYIAMLKGCFLSTLVSTFSCLKIRIQRICDAFLTSGHEVSVGVHRDLYGCVPKAFLDNLRLNTHTDKHSGVCMAQIEI